MFHQKTFKIKQHLLGATILWQYILFVPSYLRRTLWTRSSQVDFPNPKWGLCMLFVWITFRMRKDENLCAGIRDGMVGKILGCGNKFYGQILLLSCFLTRYSIKLPSHISRNGVLCLFSIYLPHYRSPWWILVEGFSICNSRSFDNFDLCSVLP